MRIELVSSAAASGVGLVLKSVAFELFGLPVSAVVLALAGGLAGLIHLPPPSELQHKWPGWIVVIANALTGCALTLLLAYIAKIEDSKLLGPLCFLIAYAPIPAVNFIRERLGVTNEPK